MQSYPPKGIGQKTPRRLGQRCKRRPQGSHEPQGRFRSHGLSMSPLIFVHIRLRFHYFYALYLGLHSVGRVFQCRILPFDRRATRESRVCLPREENARSLHQRLFRENIGKTGTCGLQTLSVKGSRVVFTHREGISTPHIRHKGRQPLIECSRHDFKIMYFSVFF